ncbi:MAG: guanylate kinase [Lachnospiraceae bacterium]|nr:guanylate kinase [Lachnospiraceae bacterium]
MEHDGILVVISGFAGAGKGTIVKGLLKDYDNYALSVSMTTRQPRPGEVNGEAYFFVSREEFEKTIEEGGLIEHAQYVDNYYGTPKAYVEEKLKAGMDVILEIELQGALQIKKLYPEALLLFVTPPSAAILKQRLTDRGTETAEVIKKRMDRAAEESEMMDRYDHIIVNDKIEDCVAYTHSVIQAAHSAPGRLKKLTESLQRDLRNMSEGKI